MAGSWSGSFSPIRARTSPSSATLADALEAGGEIKVWLDEREIDYGENIVLKIADGLDADFVLLILSPDSVDSKWVKEEWTDAYWEQVVKPARKACRRSLPRMPHPPAAAQ